MIYTEFSTKYVPDIIFVYNKHTHYAYHVVVPGRFRSTRASVSISIYRLIHVGKQSRMYSGSFAEVEISPVYFDREDVKRAIHAPLNVTWSECSENSVFAGLDGQDQSAPSYTVLPNVIEKSERTVLVHGLADFLIIAEG